MEFDRVRRNVGFRFLPTDDELVVDYLLSKLIGLPLPSDDYVKDCNLYGDLEPWDIWNHFQGAAHEEEDEEDADGGDEKKNDLYFFTPLKKRTATGQRIDRSVGSNGGAWHGEDSGKESQTLDGAVSWIQKRFTYRAKKSKDDKGTQSSCCSWIMHEYCLVPIPALGLDYAAASKLAVCRLRKKESSKKRKNNNNNKSAPRVILIHDAADNDVAPAASDDQGSTTTYKRRKLHGGDDQQVVVVSSSVDVEMERPCLLSEVLQGSASGGGHEDELVSPPFQAEPEGCSSAVLKEEEEELDSLFDKEIEECLADVKEDNGIDGNGNQEVVSPSFFQAGSNEGEGAMTQQQSVEMELLVTAEEAAWWSAVSASAEGTCNVNDAFGFNVDCGYTVEGLLAECCC
ncbi:unnamed protein product [Linum trigynum]|uniref:NAC domain-containing protein n=1 Tax=Linum trigynum TaxID=586398 RepID=A0AAV2DKM7_9ROSI